MTWLAAMVVSPGKHDDQFIRSEDAAANGGIGTLWAQMWIHYEFSNAAAAAQPCGGRHQAAGGQAEGPSPASQQLHTRCHLHHRRSVLEAARRLEHLPGLPTILGVLGHPVLGNQPLHPPRLPVVVLVAQA